MNRILIVDAEKCTGCRLCEVYCSLEKTGTCNPARSRVRVISWEEHGLHVPSMCQHCEDAPCILVCPVKAISKDRDSGMVRTDPKVCIGCKICLMTCPFGAPSIDPVELKVTRCDLCDGNPVCASICSTRALSYMRADRVGLLRKREGLEKLSSLLRFALPKVIGGE